MADPPPVDVPLVIVGANHRSAPLTLREQLFIDDIARATVFDLLRSAGIAQSVILSTCDRVEIHSVHQDPTTAAKVMIEALSRHSGISVAELGPGLYTKHGAGAARHLFSIAASLDSLVVGEPQVLGQVKASERAARAAGMIGSELDTLLQAAFATAKRIRSETTIGERPVSIAAAAVSVARDVHGAFQSCAGLLIGLAEMGDLVCRAMQEAGLGRWAICDRKATRAASLARQLGANILPMESLDDALAVADVVVTGVGLGPYILTPALMVRALKRRRRKPVFIVDVAVPRDSDPAINDLDDAFVYDLGDLEQVTRTGIADREAAAKTAWRLVDSELENLLRSRAMRAAVPTVVALRNHFETTRSAVLEEIQNGDASTATRLLINRLLHDPSEVLREIAADAEDGADRNRAEDVLKRLFRLNSEKGNP